MTAAASYASGTAYVRGRYLPVDEACVPILDYGFLRSDATRDVAHVRKGRFFRLEAHLTAADLRAALEVGWTDDTA